MTEIDVSGWKKIGTSDNADFYEVEPHVLAVVPFEGAVDDAATAKASIRIQLEYLRANSTRAGVLVFMDRVVEQEASARAVYRDDPDPAFQICFALIGGTAFGRAVGSVFIGLSPPPVPTKLFANVDAALAWVHSRLAGR